MPASGPSVKGRFPVKFASIDNAAALGDTTVVAAVTGKNIRVLDFWCIATAATVIKFTDGAAGTELTGDAALAANGGASVHSVHGLFETSRGTALVLNSSVATQVGGSLSYIEVD